MAAQRERSRHRFVGSRLAAGVAGVFVAGLIVVATTTARADGASLFQANCAGCHGATGKADTPMAPILKVPPLSGTKLTTDEIVKHVREAKSHAAPSQALNDEELSQVATAVKSL